MKKFLTSLISVFLFVAVASCSVNQTRSIEFYGDAIKNEFEVGDSLEFSVKVNDGTKDYIVKLRLTYDGQVQYLENPGVTGIVVTGFDTRTSGEKTLRVQYGKAFVSAVYVVKGGADEEMLGSGTEADPYLVATPYHLAKIGEEVGKYYKLVRDINLSNFEWASKDINGVTIDGNNKTVSNLYLNNTLDTTLESALFKNVYGEVVIKNLYLKNFEIIGDSYNAALVGRLKNGSKLTLTNVHADRINITAIHYVGALVGYTTSGNVELNVSNCSVSNANLVANFDGNDGDKVGAVVGQAQGVLNIDGVTVTNLVAWGVRDVGGLAGYAVAEKTLISNVTVSGYVYASHNDEARNSGNLPAEPGSGKLIGSLSTPALSSDYDFTPRISNYNVTGVTALSLKTEWGNNFLVGSFRCGNDYATVNENLKNK